MNNKRKEVLLNLIMLNCDLDVIKGELIKFDWDSEESLVSITSQLIRSILERVVSKQVSFELLEDWAILIGHVYEKCPNFIGRQQLFIMSIIISYIDIIVYNYKHYYMLRQLVVIT